VWGTPTAPPSRRCTFFGLRTEFDANIQQDYFFQADSKTDFDHWQDLLKTASYEYNSALRVLLQHRQRGISYPPSLKSYNDGTYAQRRAVLDYRTNLGELPTKETFRSGNNVSLRISLSAQQLTNPSFVVSNTYILVQVKYLTWFDFHRTEVRRSTDPDFKESAVFNFDYSLTTRMNQTRLRVIVFHDSGKSATVKDGDSSANLTGFHPFGVAECRIQDITHARAEGDDHGCLELPLLDSNDRSQKSAGVIKLEVKDLVPMNLLERAQLAASRVKVARLGAKIEGPVFRFGTTTASGEVRAREFMGESPYFQLVPSKLLEIYTKEDTATIRDLQSLDSVLGKEDWDSIVRPVFEHLLQRQALYHQHTAMLDSHQGSTFRASIDKKSKTLEMTPLNCHIQRLQVLNRQDQVEASYDIITHGAPAAHSLKFSHGGLRSILQKNTDHEWLGYRKRVAEYKTHLQSIQGNVDSSALKLINSFDEIVKAKMKSEGEEATAFAVVQGERTRPYSSEDNAAIRAARESGQAAVRITDGAAVDGQPQQLEVRFGDNAVSPAWKAAPSTRMLQVDLATHAGCRVEELRSKTVISAADLIAVERLVGTAEFFVSFLKDHKQHALIDNALADTLELRMNKPNIWSPRELVGTDAAMSANPFVHVSREDAAPPGPIGGHPRRMASFELSSSARTRVNLLEEVTLSIGNLLDVKALDVIEVIAHLNNLRRTIKSAIADIQHAMLITELQKRADHLDETEHRRDVAFSQGCTILVTAFVSSLQLYSKDPVFLEQLSKIGYLAQFESLLSTHGNEMGMIEDMAQATNDLKGVTFKLGLAADNSQAFQSLVLTGRRYEICIEVMIHKSFYDRLPPGLKKGDCISVVPIFFSHGVNEMQTIANKIGDTGLQDEIVTQGYTDMVRYTTEYKKHVCPLMNDPRRAIRDLDLHVAQLDKAIKTKKAKNVLILVAAQRIARKMKAGRLTCCKSGKDRTGMSATLEQCNILIDEHHMDQCHLQNALDVMRSIGTRMDNVEKNIGERKYAFNRLQIAALPKLLKPPLMSIGSQVT
jgi:inositol polyphosphate-4-phosphatase